MRRLILLVEGQTEEKFVSESLAPHLASLGVDARPVVVTTARHSGTGQKHKGGGQWRHWSADLKRLLPARRDPDVRVSTMIDLYGLPDDFPGADELNRVPTAVGRAEQVERILADSMNRDPRLIPYVQVHEFEALVIASLDCLGVLLDTNEDHDGLSRLRAELQHSRPEEVNDHRSTAPSKRLEQHIPSYRKTIHGIDAIMRKGLPEIREACPRFDSWVRQLEALGQASTM